MPHPVVALDAKNYSSESCTLGPTLLALRSVDRSSIVFRFRIIVHIASMQFSFATPKKHIFRNR